MDEQTHLQSQKFRARVKIRLKFTRLSTNSKCNIRNVRVRGQG